MKGLDIFTHSARQVLGNLPDAIKISAVPYAVQFAVSYLVLRQTMGAGGGMGGMMMGQGQGGSIALVLLNLVVMLVTGIWMAVAWHRFVLKEERPAGFIPPFHADKMLAYFLRSLGIAIICIILAIPLGMVAGLIAYPFISPNGMGVVAVVIMMLITYFPLALISYRLSTSLPAVALDEGGNFMDGWEATRGATADLAVLALISVVIYAAGSIIGLYVFGGSMALYMIWNLVFTWLVMMIGVSVLTTLYGHYVQHRDLV